MNYIKWCEDNNSSHAHCPDGCEHPQPQLYNGVLVCGRCLHKYNEVVPCGLEVCQHE